jgi:FkbM family methyltransferase
LKKISQSLRRKWRSVFHLKDDTKFLRWRVLVRAWRYRLRTDTDEIQYLLGTLRKGDVVVDIGAHRGSYTYWMQRAVGGGGKVFSFEPQPALAAFLKRMVATLGFRQVTVEHLGVSSVSGQMTLLVPRSSYEATFEADSISGDHVKHSVHVVTLDEYFAEHCGPKIRLIKCDAEGHELEIFRGGRRILESHHPILVFECESRHLTRHTPQDVFQFLESLGYSGFFHSDGQLAPLADYDLATHGNFKHEQYVNNFTFIARETNAR